MVHGSGIVGVAPIADRIERNSDQCAVVVESNGVAVLFGDRAGGVEVEVQLVGIGRAAVIRRKQATVTGGDVAQGNGQSGLLAKIFCAAEGEDRRAVESQGAGSSDR